MSKSSKIFLQIFLSVIIILIFYVISTKTAFAADTSKTLAELIKNEGVTSSWKFILNLINYFIIIILIVIAFANILRVQIDTYAIKKVLPTLIIAIILANFSFLICQMVLSFANALYHTIITLGKNGSDTNIFLKQIYNASLPGWEKYYNATGGVIAKGGLALIVLGTITAPLGLLAGFLIGLVVILFPAVALFLIWFLLLIRKFVILFLVVISPLAFFAVGLPMTSQYFKMWWDNFLKWTFMPAAAFLVMKIAMLIAPAIGSTSGNWGGVIQYAFVTGSLVVAIMVPFKLGGSIMAGWANASKWLGKTGAGLGWKGYGSAMYHGAKWAEKNKDVKGSTGAFARGLLPAMKATNLYGLPAFLKEREEVEEKGRQRATRQGDWYERVAGTEAAYRYALSNDSEVVRGIMDKGEVGKYIASMNKEMNLPASVISDWANKSPSIVKEDIEKYGKKLDAQKVADLVLAYRQLQSLARYGTRTEKAADEAKINFDKASGTTSPVPPGGGGGPVPYGNANPSSQPIPTGANPPHVEQLLKWAREKKEPPVHQPVPIGGTPGSTASKFSQDQISQLGQTAPIKMAAEPLINPEEIKNTDLITKLDMVPNINPSDNAELRESADKLGETIKKSIDSKIGQIDFELGKIGISKESKDRAIAQFRQGADSLAIKKGISDSIVNKTDEAKNLTMVKVDNIINTMGKEIRNEYGRQGKLNEVKLELPVRFAYEAVKGKADFTNKEDLASQIKNNMNMARDVMKNAAMGSGEGSKNAVDIAMKINPNFKLQLSGSSVSENANKASEIAKQINDGSSYMLKKLEQNIKDPVAHFEKVAKISAGTTGEVNLGKIPSKVNVIKG